MESNNFRFARILVTLFAAMAMKMTIGRYSANEPGTPTTFPRKKCADPQRNNDFNFKDDPKGRVVPLGCHMRRLNPRDSELTLLTDVNIHRIIRRSSTFGPKWTPDVTAADESGVPLEDDEDDAAAITSGCRRIISADDVPPYDVP